MLHEIFSFGWKWSRYLGRNIGQGSEVPTKQNDLCHPDHTNKTLVRKHRTVSLRQIMLGELHIAKLSLNFNFSSRYNVVDVSLYPNWSSHPPIQKLDYQWCKPQMGPSKGLKDSNAFKTISRLPKKFFKITSKLFQYL